MTFSPSTSYQLRGAFLVAFSGLLYGMIGYFGTKLFSCHFSVENMLFWRFFIAMLWVVMTSLWTKESLFHPHTVDYLLLGRTILIGVVAYSAGSSFYFIASKHIGTGLAMVIFFSAPVFVTLFAWLFSSWRMNKYAFSSLVAVIGGLILLKGQGEDQLDLLGILFAIIAAFFYAIYIYFNQYSAKVINSRLLTFLICLGNTIIFFAVASYTHTLAMPRTLDTWFYVGVISIVSTALPIQLLLDGLKYISPIKASILSVLEPVVTVLMGVALLDESISSMQLVGVLIILLGALFIQFDQHETKTKDGRKNDVKSPLYTS